MSNSQAEYTFKARYEKSTGHKLRHGNIQEPDWIDMVNGKAWEVKGVNYPRAHFRDKIRVNAMSISRHALENPDSKIVLVFTDNQMLTGEPKRIVENSTVEPSQYSGDRLTYVCDLNVFEPF